MADKVDIPVKEETEETFVIPLVVKTDEFHFVKCTLVNETGAGSLELTDGADQIKTKASVPAPASLDDGSSASFTMSPGDKLTYKIGGGSFVLKFSDDDDHPKLKDEEGDVKDFNIETTEREIKTEIEKEIKTKTKKSWTKGAPLPESKSSKKTSTETKSGNAKVEKKIEIETEVENFETKTTVEEEIEYESSEITITWALLKA